MSLAIADFVQTPTSPVLAATLARASEAAESSGAAEVSLEHLLASLCEDSDAVGVLDASRVDISKLLRDISDYLSRTTVPIANPGTMLVVSPGLKRILEAAAAAAQGGRRRDINGAIVLAAIVGDGKSAAAQMLQAQGLTFDEAIRALQAALTPQRASVPPPAEDVLARARERVQSRAAPSLREIMSDFPRPASPPPIPGVVEPALPLPDAAYVPFPSGPIRDPVGELTGGEPAAIAVPPEPAAARPEPSSPSLTAESGGPVWQPAKIVPEVPKSQKAADPIASRMSASSASITAPASPTTWPAQSGAPEPTLAHSPAPTSPVSETENAEVSDFESGLAYNPGAQWNSAATAAPQEASVGERPKPQSASEPPTVPVNGVGEPQSSYVYPASPQLGPGVAPAAGPIAFEFPRPAAGQRPPPLPPPLPKSVAQPPPLNVPRPLQTPKPGGAAAGLQAPAMPVPPPPPALGGNPPAPALPSAGSKPQAKRRERPKLAAGQLAENIPRRMTVGRAERIEIRIAKADAKAIGEGLEGGGAAWTHEVTITKAMSVRLRAPDGGFFIETASPETQWIESQLGLISDDFASWRFLVTPRERGRSRLQIIVSARTVGTDGVAAETALPDQVIDVKVRSNYARVMARVLGWIVAAIAGGALARFGDGVLDAAKPIFERFMQ